ncbi:MAG: rRNA maturation RNase YbeY [Flavobacteriales bacterium]|jgi:probable rRNA maturation factor
MARISFHNEDIAFVLPQKRLYKQWIEQTVLSHGKTVGGLTYVFCSDEYLLEMNKTYLQHDYYTDIITFDYSEENNISGDLFISVDRVKDNAFKIGVSLQNEMQRVVIHGVLHLCGFKDKEKTDVEIMRKMEEKALLLFPQNKKI